MATRRLEEINAAALKPIDSTDQPKAMGLFRKTTQQSTSSTNPDPATSSDVSRVDEQLPPQAVEAPRQPVPAALPQEDPQSELNDPLVSFMAKVSESSYAALEDAVIRVRRKGGIRKFSRADVAEAMFLLFAEVVEDIEVSKLPTKVQHQGLAFRRALKELVQKTLRDKPVA